MLRILHGNTTMKQHLFSLLFVVILLPACNDDVSSPRMIEGNLLSNTSFEQKGKPWLDSWSCDTTLARVTSDPTTGCGNWALSLEPGWLPQEGFARTYITGQSGTGIYQLSVLMRCTNQWRATIKIGRWTNGGWAESKTGWNSTPNWTTLSITDTLTLQTRDTIAVHLSAGATEVASARVFFDCVTLERLR